MLPIPISEAGLSDAAASRRRLQPRVDLLQCRINSAEHRESFRVESGVLEVRFVDAARPIDLTESVGFVLIQPHADAGEDRGAQRCRLTSFAVGHVAPAFWALIERHAGRPRHFRAVPARDATARTASQKHLRQQISSPKRDFLIGVLQRFS